MGQTEGRSPSQSAIETTYVLMPNQTNHYGTAFGGVIMSWIDMVAGMCAQRHCGRQVVTAAIDSLAFREPIRIGEHVILRAQVNYAGTTSMEVGVQVMYEHPVTGRKGLATTAYLTFVAVDENQQPTPVPPLVPQTDEEKRRYNEAIARVAARKRMRGRPA